MDKKTETRGKAAAEWLQEDVDGTKSKGVLVDASALKSLLGYVKALEEPPAKVTTDVYLRGDWYVTILKVDLTEDQVRLLDELGERSKDTSATIEVQGYNPAYPLPNWKGYTRK